MAEVGAEEMQRGGGEEVGGRVAEVLLLLRQKGGEGEGEWVILPLVDRLYPLAKTEVNHPNSPTKVRC